MEGRLGGRRRGRPGVGRKETHRLPLDKKKKKVAEKMKFTCQGLRASSFRAPLALSENPTFSQNSPTEKRDICLLLAAG